MHPFSRREVLTMLLAAPAARYAFCDNAGEWFPLFDGKSLNGWKLSGPPSAFSVSDGQITVENSLRSWLFYAGPVRNSDFKDFEFSADVMTLPGANSAISFHTNIQPDGWLGAGTGFQVEINNTAKGLNIKTGSLSGVRNVYKQLVDDNEWFNLNIMVRGKQVKVRLNSMLVVDCVEPDPPFRADPNYERVFSHGTFALRCPGFSVTTRFKNIRVRPLPDNIATQEAAPVVDEPLDEIDREITRLGQENFPVVDYHVHLKGGLTLEQALSNSRRLGIGYGIAINCGLNFPVHDDASVNDYLVTMKGQPCYVALQGEGREWMTFTSPESIARFDYCFTDAMTFRDPSGFRRRLYVENEMGDLSDPQAFMEIYVARIEGVMKEPIDTYANPTFLPLPLRLQYDSLWTPARMKRVIDAAIENDVAIEINNRYRIPTPTFIKAARAAGAKFSFGTNNAEAGLGRIEYPIKMVRECGLRWNDIFVPKPDGQKPIQVKKWQMTRE